MQQTMISKLTEAERNILITRFSNLIRDSQEELASSMSFFCFYLLNRKPSTLPLLLNSGAFLVMFPATLYTMIATPDDYRPLYWFAPILSGLGVMLSVATIRRPYYSVKRLIDEDEPYFVGQCLMAFENEAHKSSYEDFTRNNKAAFDTFFTKHFSQLD